MKAVIKKITIPQNKRVVCISDIHGNLDLFKELLKKIKYNSDDILILLGDLYTKGKQCHETLKYILTISNNPNVHILRGNCDKKEDYLTDAEKAWLDTLPHIIESDKYIFVHGGISSERLEDQDARACMKNDAFMEKGLKFNRYVITGHWPTVSYSHKIPCYNPIIDNESRIVAIDGGVMIKYGAQLNAFFIINDEFSYETVDDLPTIRINKPQASCGGDLSITWLDRYIELIEDQGEFGLYRHVHTGKAILLPTSGVWKDDKGNLCTCDISTNYYLPVEKGEVVSVISSFSNKIFAKKNGIAGWINI